MPGIQQTYEQKRAQAAWECVKQVRDRPDGKLKRSYSSLVRSFPALVQGSGLGQALAFLFAKSEGKLELDSSNTYGLLYSHLNGWLMKQVFTSSGNNDVLQAIMTGSSSTYRWATIEALAYCTWLKRFAEAELSPLYGAVSAGATRDSAKGGVG